VPVVDRMTVKVELKELEKKQKTFLDRKKEVLEKVKEADEELREIREEEMAIQERQQQIWAQKKEVEQMRWSVERLKIENAKLKRVLQERELQTEYTKSVAGTLDTGNDRKETDEEQTLEEQRKWLAHRKKAVFERTKTTEDELWKIRQEEMDVQGRLQQIRADKKEMEHMRRAIERYKMENSKLRELHGKLTKSLDEVRAHAAESGNKVERLEAELSCMKENVAVYEREHGGAGFMSVMKELRMARQQNVEHNNSLRKMKSDIQRIESYSKTQRKEKEQAMRRIARLEDEIAAFRQMSAETQRRQLDEIQSSSTAVKQQQQRTGNELKWSF